jgi:hypothetical protein
MTQRVTGVPLAFALAMSASMSDASALGSPAITDSIEPGSLRALLNGVASTDQLPRSTGQLSQWFNGGWFNCSSASWRRC